MLQIPHVSAMVVVAAGNGAADIVRLAQQPEIQQVQQWVSASRPDPEIQAGRTWLDRKASEQERALRGQQRQQAEAAVENGTISGEVAVEDGPAVDQAAGPV